MPTPPPTRESQLRRFLQSWAINTLAVLVAVVLLPGIHYRSTTDLFVASLLLGILNAFIRPILLLVALPLLILTLGLFMLVINACMLGLVHVLMGAHFEVDGFGWALLGAIIISVVSTALNLMTGGAKSRFSLRVQRRPPGNRPDGGNGPVIDV